MKNTITLARRRIESFDASYGWSLEGISSTAGIGSLWLSITCLIISATCVIQQWSRLNIKWIVSVQTHILVDENDVDVIPLQETLEAFLYFADAGICDTNKNITILYPQDKIWGHTLVYDHKVWLPILVHLSNTTQEESNTSVLQWIFKKSL